MRAPTVAVSSCKILNLLNPIDCKCKRALTCFVGAWRNILESRALSQNTEFAVAVFTIKLFCLTVGKVLMKVKRQIEYFRGGHSSSSRHISVLVMCAVLTGHVWSPAQGRPGSS